MSELSQQSCQACRVGAPAVPIEQQRALLETLPNWRVEQVDGVPRLTRSYPFDDFQKALAFTNKVGALAEQEQHHPLIVTEWGKVTLCWWTHKIKDLHMNDFVMAAKSDELE